MTATRAQVLDLAARSADAYSADRYADWFKCADLLVRRRAYSLLEAEAILRSKWMRWAADSSAVEYGQVPHHAIDRFLNAMKPEKRAQEVAALVAETFAATEAR